MALTFVKDFKDAQVYQLLVGIPILIVAFFCFSFVMMHAPHSKAGHATSVVSAASTSLPSKQPVLPVSKMHKLDIVPVTVSTSGSQNTAATQVQSTSKATNTLQSAPPTQSSNPTSLMGVPINLSPATNLINSSGILGN